MTNNYPFVRCSGRQCSMKSHIYIYLQGERTATPKPPTLRHIPHLIRSTLCPTTRIIRLHRRRPVTPPAQGLRPRGRPRRSLVRRTTLSCSSKLHKVRMRTGSITYMSLTYLHNRANYRAYRTCRSSRQVGRQLAGGARPGFDSPCCCQEQAARECRSLPKAAEDGR